MFNGSRLGFEKYCPAHRAHRTRMTCDSQRKIESFLNKIRYVLSLRYTVSSVNDSIRVRIHHRFIYVRRVMHVRYPTDIIDRVRIASRYYFAAVRRGVVAGVLLGFRAERRRTASAILLCRYLTVTSCE